MTNPATHFLGLETLHIQHPTMMVSILHCPQDGRRDGIGIKTYADGSMYDGFWKAGKKHGLGVFRPAPEETGSRRHSNHMGWQQQQQQQPRVSGTGADFPPADPAAESAFAGQEQLAAISTSSDSHGVLQAGAAAGPAQGVQLQEQHGAKHSLEGTSGSTLGGHTRQQQQQPLQLSLPQEQPSVAKQLVGGKQHLVSPFLAAAAALNSETSIVGEPPKLPNGSWQQQHSPDLAADAAAAAAAGTSQGASPPAAAGGDIPSSSSPTEATTAAAAGGKGTELAEGAVAPAAMTLSSTAAPRKLFVREYVMGQLVREYPLTAEEIKMIFGFLWPKQNKVRR